MFWARDVTVKRSELFLKQERRESKNLLLDLTVVSPCALSNPEKETERLGSAIMTFVK